MSRLSAWSFSRLVIGEQCPYRARLAFADRIPEPERELPPGKTEQANERGQRVHDGAELFVRGTGLFLPEMAHFEPEFLELTKLYKDGKVSLEGEWGFNEDWEPVEWRSRDAWARIKLDALVFLNPYEAVVIDYKTGKKFGNEIKHAEQCQLYQLATFLRYPDLETVHTELWYLDINDISQTSYTRERGMMTFPSWDRRGHQFTDRTEFPAKPNMFNCKWCPYGPKGTGHCEVGIQ